MRTINKAPEDWKKTKLFSLLLTKKSPDHQLVGMIETVVSRVTPLLDSINGGVFHDYTLHDSGHAKKVAHLMGEILDQDSLDSLSALEIAVLLAVAYLHDLGMSVSYAERNVFLQSGEFAEILRSNRDLSEQFGQLHEIQTKKDVDALTLNKVAATLYQLQDVVLCNYFRRSHYKPERYAEVLTRVTDNAPLDNFFSYQGVPISDYIINICASHGESASVLVAKDENYNDIYPTDVVIAGERLNIQFCCALLRIADILDFDSERTPATLFASLGLAGKAIPGSEISLLEWNKHKSVHSITVDTTEIAIHADCRHPAIEQGVRLFAKDIEREVTHVTRILQKTGVGNYRLGIPPLVSAKIRSLGYVYRELSFRLNEDAIMRLLMGANLYQSPAVAARELIQNAIDACRVRARLENDEYAPSVVVRYISEGRDTFIEVVDNGIGMDEYVLTEYFFTVGKSYYSSTDFERLIAPHGGMQPIARFGIGIMSVFMLGDYLEITTCNRMSATGDERARKICVTAGGGLAVVKELPAGVQGTTIKLRLQTKYSDREVFGAIVEYLGMRVIRPLVPVKILDPIYGVTLSAPPEISLQKDAELYLSSKGLSGYVVSIVDSRNIVSGQVVLVYNNVDGFLSHKRDGRALAVSINYDLRRIVGSFAGNRVTVDGFAMQMKKLARVLGRNGAGLAAYDIEIRGVAEVEYNVAREKITGNGVIFVRRALRNALIETLKHHSIWGKLSKETSTHISKHDWMIGDRVLIRPAKVLPTPEQVDAVAAAMPREHWPTGIHVQVAESLGISIAVVRSAVTELLRTGRLKNPNPPRARI